jgi:type IV pilus assembly protein PilC
MLAAGLPLSRALSVLERQNTNAKLQEITKTLRERIAKGEQLNEALAAFPNVFSRLYTSMVRAGEESGGLSEALRVLALQLEQSATLRKKIRGAMIYPSIIIIVMAGIGVLMMIYVMPTITATFLKLGIDLPLTTRILIGASQFFNAYAIEVLIGAVALIGALAYAARTAFGKRIVHFTIIHLPIIGGIAKEVNAARTTRTLSSLLSSGVDVLEALRITKDVLQNVYYQAVLDEAAVKVEKGEPLSGTFVAHENLYPVLVGEMVLVGEETGQIAGMLDQVAVFYENEVSQKTKDLSTVIEPILMVFIGSVVGFFALAMIVPIYSLSDSIK